MENENKCMCFAFEKAFSMDRFKTSLKWFAGLHCSNLQSDWFVRRGLPPCFIGLSPQNI